MIPIRQTRKATSDIGSLRVNGVFKPSSVDLEKRTIEVVFTTGESGKRWHWDLGYYLEELEVSEKAIRSARLDKGLSVIDSHDQYRGVGGVYGVTEEYRIENGELIGTLRFAEDEESDKVFGKVKDGILRHFSLGYDVFTYEAVINPDSKGLDTYRAVDWEPLELSIVPVSFETTNGVRGKPDTQELHELHIIGDNDMRVLRGRVQEPDNGNGNQLPGVTAATPEPALAPAVRAAEPASATPEPASATPEPALAPAVRAAEPTVNVREHLPLMRAAAASAGLDVNFAVDAFERGVEPTEFNAQIIAELGKRSLENVPNTILRGEHRDHKASIRCAVERALMARCGIVEHDNESNQYAGASLMDMARIYAGKQGENLLGMSATKLVGRAFMSTSDFPLILENVMHKSLSRGYEETPRTFLGLGNRTTVTDFRSKHTYKIGDAPSLLPLGENGEYKSGTISESKESYAIDTYARKLGLSRKMIINDDMSALNNLPRTFGAAGSRLESDIVWGLLLNYDFRNNKAASFKMQDGKALFHADHGNLLTGAGSALSATSLSDIRKLGRKMKTLDNNFMNIMWNTLVLPEDLETAAEKLLINTILANQTADTNSFQGKYEFRIEPRLAVVSETAWYAFTNMLDAFEYAYLAGEEGMMTEVVNSTDVDGMEVLVRKDFGAGYVDHRGVAKAAGA